jgi:hypothetical protein
MIPQEERDYIQALAKWRARNGKAQPNHVALQPVVLDAKHADIWDAFLELKASAPVGMGSNSISASDCYAWCQLHSIPQWRWPSFWRIIHHLDNVARRSVAERRGKQHGDASASG